VATVLGEAPSIERTRPALGRAVLSVDALPDASDSLWAISGETLPHLSEFVERTLNEMGLSGRLQPMLDVEGGTEAYLAAPFFLVVGAGALGVFGPEELTYLLALAVCLGPDGHLLKRPDGGPGLEKAAVEAFGIYPSPAAAGTVLAHLDERCRHGAPEAVEAPSLLPENAPFAAVARAVLEKMLV
jgi:hypothetical protein